MRTGLVGSDTKGWMRLIVIRAVNNLVDWGEGSCANWEDVNDQYWGGTKQKTSNSPTLQTPIPHQPTYTDHSHDTMS